MKKLLMSFLPDVRVLCDTCHGARFNPETLGVNWKGKSLGNILAMNEDEAVVLFAAHPFNHHDLQLLRDVCIR